MFFSAIIVAEAVVGEAQGFREHPAFAVVLGKEGFQPFFLEIVEGDEGKDSVTQFWVFVFVYAPKPFGIKVF